MEVERQEISRHNQALNTEETMNKSLNLKRSLLLLNCALLVLGNCGGPLLIRLYFLHGGKRIWFSSWLETAGWPILLLPLLFSYSYRRSQDQGEERGSTRLFLIKPRLFAASAILGIITGLDDYLYAYGLSRLPVSTSALIASTQLIFTAIFAFFLVRQTFTSYSINSIVMLTIGALVMALHTGSDRPSNESNTQYYTGFFMTIGASALYGLVLPLVELTYKKSNQLITYSLVIEMQLVISIFATAFCSLGMLVNNDFKSIPKDASEYEIGEAKYYLVIVWSAILWQLFFLGLVGVIFCGSSMLGGIIIAAVIPVTEILAVIFCREKFKAEKGISLALCLWGFTSYFYGEIKGPSKKNSETPQPDTTPYV
ncbi:PREDICTED: purine permease 3-like [Nelumbo nucifera]|uniref:Probable purine permease n=2 Tax=Nelumbo nucifera TaxID=4432 RepID=A0A1U8AHI6_NELNU|nr:PREDICTED: purine permease 3-like [Nelumbo nucifera]DAD41000.1 TPA_asm: hypothetical protein HUJ06_015323 [Nelumbo nucifera]